MKVRTQMCAVCNMPTGKGEDYALIVSEPVVCEDCFDAITDEKGNKWTTEVPTAPGWYCLRRPGYKDTKVRVFRSGRFLCIRLPDPRHGAMTTFSISHYQPAILKGGAEWSGPIHPPEAE